MAKVIEDARVRCAVVVSKQVHQHINLPITRKQNKVLSAIGIFLDFIIINNN